MIRCLLYSIIGAVVSFILLLIIASISPAEVSNVLVIPIIICGCTGLIIDKLDKLSD